MNKQNIILLFFSVLILTAFKISSKSNLNNMSKIEIGDKIPGFVLNDQNGNPFDINDVIGKKNLVIFFYPKDDTPGCTKEACYFRDHYEAFTEVDTEVIGISGQTVESHKNFAAKHNLSYKILSDTDNQLRKKFGVPTSLFGLLPGRVTYVVNISGKVIHIFNSQTNISGHIDEALQILKRNE